MMVPKHPYEDEWILAIVKRRPWVEPVFGANGESKGFTFQNREYYNCSVPWKKHLIRRDPVPLGLHRITRLDSTLSAFKENTIPESMSKYYSLGGVETPT